MSLFPFSKDITRIGSQLRILESKETIRRYIYNFLDSQKASSEKRLQLLLDSRKRFQKKLDELYTSSLKDKYKKELDQLKEDFFKNGSDKKIEKLEDFISQMESYRQLGEQYGNEIFGFIALQAKKLNYYPQQLYIPKLAIVEFIHGINTEDFKISKILVDSFSEYYLLWQASLEAADGDVDRLMREIEYHHHNIEILNAPIKNTHEYYDFYFFIGLRQTPLQKVHAFLNYHFGQFKDDFKHFLEIVLIEYEEYFNEKQVKVIQKWLANMPEKEQVNTIKSNLYLSKKRGTKIAFIRILTGIYDNRLIVNEMEQVPSQETYFKECGKLFNVNLENYDQDLSNGFKSTLENNLIIFKKLERAIQERHIKSNS